MCGKVRCGICGEEFDLENDEYEVLGDWSDCIGYSYLRDDLDGATICYGCIENLHMYGNKLVYRDEHGRISVVFDEDMYFFDAEEYEDFDNLPKIMERLEKIMKMYEWKNTDGWRGFYESRADVVDGWVRAVEGWNDSFGSSTYVERVKEVLENIKPNIIVFPRSSNLCVVYYDLWVRKEKARLVQNLIIPEGEHFNFAKGIYIKANIHM